MIKCLWCTLFAFCGAQNCSGYELATHAAITLNAYSISILTTDTQTLSNLGLLGNPIDLGSDYFDISGMNALRRSAKGFEGKIIDNLKVNRTTLPGWLMRGAIREDDYASVFGNWKAPNPQNDQDKPQAFWRVMNHFFDPYINRPLTLTPTALQLFKLAAGETDAFRAAPNWALGQNDAFAVRPVPDSGTRNHYTVLDAREAMYRALTGFDKDGNLVATTETDRKTYWATTFRALGDILHLNQDMAQPQHTRNDPHSGVPGFGHKSVYEAYIDARASGQTFYSVPGVQVPLSGLVYTGYQIPVFARYSDFWSTNPGNGSVNGAGLADYSNSSFFTAGTNLGNNNYVSPSNNPAAYAKVAATGLSTWPLQRFSFLVGGSNNIRMTTESIFDFGLTTTSPTYSLNAYNYDDMADLLIPRAVAYSAGLINYFFRGKMEISLPDQGVYGIADHSVGAGFQKIRLKLKNTTPNNEAMVGGQLIAVARYHKNSCYQPNLSGEWGAPGQSPAKCRDPAETITTSTPVSAVTLNATDQAFQFTFSSAIPFGISDLSLQVVYRGPLGQENDAVVVATKNISEPTYFALYNFTDYVVCVNSTYYRNDASGNLSAAALAAIAAAQGNPNGLGPSPFGATQMAFYRSPPLVRPLVQPLVLAQINSLQPGHLVRLALLGDTDVMPYGLDIPGYTFITNTSIPPEENDLTINGNTSHYQSTGIQSIRGNNTYLYTFGYKYWGTDCQNTPASTIDPVNPPTPPAVLDPLSTINF